jgi:ankyrin repeat protein
MTAQSHFSRVFLSLAAALSLVTPVGRAGEIHDLLKARETEKAKALLAKHPEMKSTRDGMKQTPLHVAADYGQVEIVKLLLEQGAEVDARAYNEFTPLQLTESPEVVKLLIAHKADVDVKCLGTTALQRAADRLQRADEASAPNWRAITKTLLDAGARYDLLSATYLGDLDRVKVVLKDDPRQALDKGAMREAARGGRTAIVKLLLDHKADPNDADFGGLPVLYFALDRPDIVRHLIGAGADVKSHLKDERLAASGPFPKGTLLHHAARLGQVETAKQLIEAGAEVDARDPAGITALGYAASGGSPEVVKLLLRNKANVRGKDGRTAIAAAAGQINYAEQDAKKIERYKAVIVTLSGEGVPIELPAAIALGDLDRVKQLLKENPALAATKGRDGKPVLAQAVGLDHKEILIALLDAGAPIEGKDEGGRTALHAAAFWGREEIAKLLIGRRANVNASAADGGAPLHESARCGNPGVARLLLAAGAEVNAKDGNGKTPLARVSASKKAAELIELLKASGGR